MTADDASVIRMNVLAIQCCVPETWTRAEIETWANEHHKAGRALRWGLRTQAQCNDRTGPERTPCVEPETPDRVHVVLTC